MPARGGTLPWEGWLILEAENSGSGGEGGGCKELEASECESLVNLAGPGTGTGTGVGTGAD